MVSVEKNHAEQASKKKHVTFSFCTDSDPKAPIQRLSEVSTRLSKCIDKDSGYNNKYCSLPVSSHKRQEKPESVKVSRKICDVKKTLVRNVEQVVGPHCALSRGRLHRTVPLNIVHDKPGSDVKKSSYKSKFVAPELYTTLCIAKEIQDTARSDVKRPSSIGINTPAKQVLDVKMLSKLNFPFEEKLYKDLVSLTVCDEELLDNNDKVGSKKEVEVRQCKDKEPRLMDFCSPSGGKEYSVVEQPEFCAMDRMRSYNGFTLYQRSQTWSDDQG